MSKKYLITFVLLFFLINEIESQVLSFNMNDLRSMNLIEAKNNNKLLFFCERYLVNFDLKTQKIIDTVEYSIKDSTVSIPDIITNYRSKVIGDEIFFIENTGGGVFKFKNYQFEKIDNSYSHRLQFGSTAFVYSDKIYQYGGYGFFSNRDFLTYFDYDTKSWELVDPIKSVEIPVGTSGSISNIINDELYLFNGNYIDKYNRKINKTLRELWKFSLKNNEWKKVGKILINENEIILKFFKYGNKIIGINNKGFLLEIDILANKINRYKGTNFTAKLNEGILPIYNNDYLYCIINNPIKNTLELHIRKTDDFFGEYINDSKLYLDNSYKNIYYISIFIGLVISLLFLINKKRKNKSLISIRNNKVYFLKKLIDLDESEFKIIKFLLSKSQGATNSEIMDITETKGLNYSHNIRQKNNKINNINLKFKANFKIDYDIIIATKSDFDHRMSIYKLNSRILDYN